MNKQSTNTNSVNPDNDIFESTNNMLIANNLPEFGTTDFNNMCMKFFGGGNLTKL
jgi:hypothetical protein